jgi:hypothetical protein
LSSTPASDRREHAEFQARESPTGIGAAVVRSDFEDDEHVWECIVTNGREWRYVRVLGTDLGPFPNISAEDIEQGIERLPPRCPHRIGSGTCSTRTLCTSTARGR